MTFRKRVSNSDMTNPIDFLKVYSHGSMHTNKLSCSIFYKTIHLKLSALSTNAICFMMRM